VIMNGTVSNRIAMLRFLMIFGVVVLHTPYYVSLAEMGNGWFDFTKAYFQHAVFRATVPVLAFVSGYLLFGAGLDLRPQQLYRKKFKSLVIPFLFFNLSLFVLMYFAQTKAGINFGEPLTPFNAKTWADEAFGLMHAPANYPLSFLRDMIVLAVLAPLLGLFLRRLPWVGLALIIPFFMLNWDRYLIFRATTPILFYLGGMAAVGNWNLLALDKYAKFCLVVFLSVCAAMVYFKIANSTYLRLASPFLVWPAAALLDRTAFGRWLANKSKYSFFLFVAHAPVLPVALMVYQKLGFVPYPVFWLVTPVATAALLIWIYNMAMRYIPTAFNTVLGTRKPAIVKTATFAPSM
jgi:succinoglycan biosynthesis protein ExoH